MAISAEGPKTAGQMREALEISEAVVDPTGLVGLGGDHTLLHD